MGSRQLPTECAHGSIVDWGDFGPDPEDGSVGVEPCAECGPTTVADADLVKRLREHLFRVAGGGPSESNYDPETATLEYEAADEIERLREAEARAVDMALHLSAGIARIENWLDRAVGLVNDFSELKRILAKTHETPGAFRQRSVTGIQGDDRG